MRFLIILLSLLGTIISCQSNEKQYQKDIIDLKHIDFNTINGENFYRYANKDNNLKISNNKQYVEINDFNNGWIEFQVKKSSDSDIVATFDSINFATINSMASNDGKIRIINCETYIKPEEVGKLYQSLKNIFGNNTKIETDKYSKYTNIYLYTWNTNNKVIKLVSIFNPEKVESIEDINAKIPDAGARIINERPKTILFICDKNYIDEVLYINNTDNNWSKFK